MGLIESVFLFEKPLVFNSKTSVEECAKRFRSYHNPREGMFQMGSTEVTVFLRDAAHCSIDMRAKQRNRTWDYTTAHMVGQLTQTADGRTAFQGIVKAGIFYLIGAIVTAFVVLIMAGSPQYGAIALLVGAVVVGYLIFTMLNDRRRLIEAVEYAMRN
ncbi:MAG: hypothetical protein R3E39_24840 [Anaerolineae bacterium]